jgi:hypothetical protein
VKSSDIFDGSSLLFEGLTADSAIFDAASPMSGQSKYFNNQCGEMEGSPDWCANSMRLTVGTESIDYSDPTAPIFKKLVAIGGRGLSIYKFTDEGLEMVWDSGDEFEREGCAAFPWAHNALQVRESCCSIILFNCYFEMLTIAVFRMRSLLTSMVRCTCPMKTSKRL